MKNKAKVLIVLALSSSLMGAGVGEALAIKYKLNPTVKAKAQWERIFDSERKLQHAGIEGASPAELKELKEFLISHAADSDNPAVPGL